MTTTSTTDRSIPLWTWLKIYTRLFAVQGSWNYETMIGNGIAFCTEPALRMTVVVWLTLRSAIPLTRRISPGAMAALTALSGLLLLCIAFQLIAAGLRELLPGLGHH